MIKLITIVVALFVTKLTAQDNYLAFSVAFDVRNTIMGSEPTNNESAKDFLVQFSMVSKDVEVNIGYETFPRLDFSKYTIGVGYHTHFYVNLFRRVIHTVFIPSIEPTLINRNGDWGGGIGYNQESSHLSLGLNLGLRWDLSDDIAVEYLFNALPRNDLKAMYGNTMDITNGKASVSGIPIIGSNFIKVVSLVST
ncbi:hypothetical protein [Flavobacterium sp. LS1P28]|uniref:hypothetical protein n=1 Tax=Flavobacterium sp. LS1P28 TaxID=2497752 RepID=UPI0011CFDC1F|nr:hypothetical protein [Flavobacterium sp. LS1P28]